MSRPRVKHLFTDASCIRQRAIAGWAGMLIDGMSSELRSGLVGARLVNATTAEIHAVRYSLRAFLALGMIEAGDTVIIHCDNQGVCLHLSNDRLQPKDQHFRAQLDRVRRTARHYQLALCAEWIKGHQGLDATDWRSLINQRCDRAAKEATRAENQRRIALGDTSRLPADRQIGP